MTYPVTQIAGIEREQAEALRKLRIRTTIGLLEAAKNPKQRKLLAERTGLPQKDILCWANMADRMRIKGVGKETAELLQAAGVDTVKELGYRNPRKLAEAMRQANDRRKLVRLLPSDRAIERWIEEARKLPPKITY